LRCWRCGLTNAETAITCARCGAALAPRSPLSAARRGGLRETDDTSWTGSSRAAAAQSSSATSRRRLRILSISLVLAVLVGFTGYGAVRAAELLQRATRPPANPADLAATACTAYVTQNYALLTAQVDPTPVPPANSDPFNPAVIQTQLRSLDKIQGIVQRCDPGHFSAIGSGGQFPLTLQRTRVGTPVTVTLILRSQPDGTWKISRETSFAGTPAS
jgi:hypothetical protein